jgi:hypothetical protein
MFPGFHLQTLRRKPRSAQQKLAQKLGTYDEGGAGDQAGKSVAVEKAGPSTSSKKNAML